jgi:hypothetical protein
MRKFEVNGTIISSAIITGSSNIKYDAGTKITLSPGFRVSPGTKFKAYIEGCGGVK